MDEKECTRFKVNLNRLFNVQKKENLPWFIGLFLLLCFYIIASCLRGKLDLTLTIITVGGYAVTVLVILFSSPAYLIVTPITVSFEYKKALSTLLLTGRIYYGIDDSSSKYTESYTVYDIKSLECLQTPLEKAFSCGHIVLCGYINVTDGQSLKKMPETFILYGLRDFESTAAWLSEFVETSEKKQLL